MGQARPNRENRDSQFRHELMKSVNSVKLAQAAEAQASQKVEVPLESSGMSRSLDSANQGDFG
jgi:hypothetical protein